MTIWVEDKGIEWYGHAWAISSERHDGIIYVANSEREAIRKYEADRKCKVDAIKHFK